MKRCHMAAMLAAFLLIFGLTGCASRPEYAVDSTDDHLKIVCTIFPQYDWTRQILGERLEDAELTLLLKNGADLHSYQPTVWDMVKISDADLFIYVGGESDFWVEDVLANAKNPDMKALNLMEVLEDAVKEEEHVEGMQGHSHEDEHDHEEAHHHEEEEAEYDEHVWLSLRNAGTICEAIADVLCELDEDGSSLYRANEEAYLAKLAGLDEKYQAMAESADKDILLFGDRFPFLYLTEDYGWSYYAAFSGCSAETEASFYTITFLAGKADELGLPAVLTIDGSDGKIARTIAGNTRTRDQKVLMLDSMQSVTEEDIRDGENYLSIMEKNLEILREALKASGR